MIDPAIAHGLVLVAAFGLTMLVIGSRPLNRPQANREHNRHWLPLHRCRECHKYAALIPAVRDKQMVGGKCPMCGRESIFERTNLQGLCKNDGHSISSHLSLKLTNGAPSKPTPTVYHVK